MTRLWIPREPNLRAASIEQMLLQHDVDIWRLRGRFGQTAKGGGGRGGESPGSPDFPTGDGSGGSSGGTSSSSSSGITKCHADGCDIDNQYEVVVAGVTGTCFTQFNRTWTLSFFADTGLACRWIERDTPASCVDGATTYVQWSCRMLISTTGSIHQITFWRSTVTTGTTGSLGSGVATYQTGVVPFDCENGHTFNRVSQAAGSSFPATLMLTKV
jgi:hypothetical protein